jgi:hypothetical protein
MIYRQCIPSDQVNNHRISHWDNIYERKIKPSITRNVNFILQHLKVISIIYKESLQNKVNIFR